MNPRVRRRLWVAVALAVGATAVSGAAERFDLLGFRSMEQGAYDRVVRSFTQARGKSEQVVLVAIDDRTFTEVRLNPSMALEYGTWPYYRSFWVHVVEQLVKEGARAVVLDMVMDEPHTDPKGDQALGEFAATTGAPLYLGIGDSPSAPQLPKVEPRNTLPTPHPPPAWLAPPEEASADFDAPETAAPQVAPEELAHALAFPVRISNGLTVRALPTKIDANLKATASRPIPPISPLVGSVAGFGLVISEEDSDGILRRTRFAYSDGQNTYVTLAVAATADLLGADALELSPGRLTLGKRSLRIDRDGSALIDYGGQLVERFTLVSAFDVVNEHFRKPDQPRALPDGLFKGKVVLVGGTAIGTADVKATPFNSYVPGMAKHAAVMDTLLGGRFIVDARYGWSLGLALFAALLAALLIGLTRSIFAELAAVPLAVGLVFVAAGTALVLRSSHLLIAMPALAGVIASLAATAMNHLAATQEGERIRASFSKFLSREVAAQLAEQDELPRLSGDRMMVTAFFSDIRGFSTFSEKFKDDPEGLVAILNTYLTRVTGVLQEHGACLDKYIGDAVVCLFGAPVRHPDHALRACKGALAAQAEVSRLREEFAAKGLPDVYTRIGLNTAVMFVGNIGSEQLFNFTAIGDGMNLAARLEGANKNYTTGIMIGPLTYEQAKEHIEARELDWVRVAGKTEPVAVYELMALKGELPPAKRPVVECYARALAEYRAGRFAAALAELEQGAALDPNDGPTRALAERCRKYLKVPPPMPFDGVANLEK